MAGWATWPPTEFRHNIGNLSVMTYYHHVLIVTPSTACGSIRTGTDYGLMCRGTCATPNPYHLHGFQKFQLFYIRATGAAVETT